MTSYSVLNASHIPVATAAGKGAKFEVNWSVLNSTSIPAVNYSVGGNNYTVHNQQQNKVTETTQTMTSISSSSNEPFSAHLTTYLIAATALLVIGSTIGYVVLKGRPKKGKTSL